MSAAPFTVGCVQTTAGLDVLPSVEAACDGVRDARKRGADLILLPESVNIIDLNKTRLLKKLDFRTRQSGALRLSRRGRRDGRLDSGRFDHS